MSNLQPNCCLKFDFQKVDQHAVGDNNILTHNVHIYNQIEATMYIKWILRISENFFHYWPLMIFPAIKPKTSVCQENALWDIDRRTPTYTFAKSENHENMSPLNFMALLWCWLSKF